MICDIIFFAFLCVSSARREYRSRSVQPQSQRPPVSSQSGPILDSGSNHGLVQRLSNSQLSFNTSIASIFSQVWTHIIRRLASLYCYSFSVSLLMEDLSLSAGPSSLWSRRDQLAAPGGAAAAALQPGSNFVLAYKYAPVFMLSARSALFPSSPGLLIFIHSQPSIWEA